MKQGDKVNTEHGKGVIVAIEKFNTFNRYGVDLENNPFWFQVPHYFKHELTLLEDKNV